MFGISDLISLVISAFIILPAVVFIREMGYVIVSWLFGVIKPRVTIGSGRRVFKFGMFDIRSCYHFYSWFSYDKLKHENKFAYISIYSGPILINLVFGLTINFLIANGVIVEYKTFWDRFVFYAFYYVLFDAVPMTTFNGKPNNGMIIYKMIRYGKRIDSSKEHILPSTSEVEKEYQEYMKEIDENEKKVNKENHY